MDVLILVHYFHTSARQTSHKISLRYNVKVQMSSVYSPCINSAGCLDHFLGGVHITILPYVHHGGPARGDDAPWPGTSHRWRGIDAPLPVRGHKILVVSVRLISVEHHWGAFGGIAILTRETRGRPLAFWKFWNIWRIKIVTVIYFL